MVFCSEIAPPEAQNSSKMLRSIAAAFFPLETHQI
jgi:hypothetical protein